MIPSQEDLGFIPEEEISQKEIPSEKAIKIAKGLRFYGWEPRPETIEKIRKPTGAALKEFAGGFIGTPGDIFNFLQRMAKIEKPLTVLPTSEQVGRVFEKLAGEEFRPETMAQQYLARGAGALGGILSLGGPLKATTLAGTLGRTAIGALVPSAVMTATEQVGLPPWMQAASGIGASILAHRISGKSLRNIEKDLYRKADTLAEGRTIPTKNLERNLTKLDKILEKGIKTGPKSALKEISNDIRDKIKNGNIKVDELMEIKRNINERMGEFEKIKGSKGLWKILGKDVDSSIKEFETVSPEFGQVYRQANSLHKGINESRYIENFIKKHPILAAHAGIIGYALKSVTSGVSLPKVALAKMGELAIALARNPGLRKTYFDILKNASKGEVRATLNSLKKFNKIAEKKEPELLEKPTEKSIQEPVSYEDLGFIEE